MDIAIFDKLLAGHPEATDFSSAVAYCPLASLSLLSSLSSVIALLLSSVLHNPSLKIFMQSLDVWLTRQSDRKMQPDRPPAGLLVHYQAEVPDTAALNN